MEYCYPKKGIAARKLPNQREIATSSGAKQTRTSILATFHYRWPGHRVVGGFGEEIFVARSATR
jgi:hypothetical protein